MVQIQKIGAGLLGTNTFIIESAQTSVIIDPDDCSDGLIKYLEENLRPSAILLTHGHFDHIGGASEISSHFDIPVYIHKDDEEMLYDSTKNASYPLLHRDVLVNGRHVQTITDDTELHFHDITIKAYHTPGHTMGSVSYLIENHLFSGDLIFEGSYGRTDLYGGNIAMLMRSIKSLKNLPGDTLVYPGHLRCRFTLDEYFDDMGL